MSADRTTATEAFSGHGLALTCDRDGRILEIADNRLETHTHPEPGHMLSEIVDEASRDKLKSLLDETCVSGSAFDWELNVKGPVGTFTVIAAGVCQGESIFIILAATRGDAAKMLEQFVAVNNELVNTIRTLQKRLSPAPAPSQNPADDFGELMRLNNDLVNLQREMAKKNAELTHSRRLVQSIVDTTPDVIYIFDLRSGRNTYTNRGYERMLGYTAGEIQDFGGEFYAELLHPDDVSVRERHLKRIARAADGQAVDWEYRVRTADGQWQWFRSRETVFERDAHGTPVEVLGSAQDITARRAAEERLVQMAIIDELTGVYNRRGLETLSRQLVAQAGRTATSIGVVFADLDGLKTINDEFGHAEGDEAIRETARILGSESRAADLVARIGGDEFVVLAHPGDEPGMENLRGRLYAAFERFNDENLRSYRLEVSVGYALCSSPGTCNLDAILSEADESMYAEKQRRRKTRDD